MKHVNRREFLKGAATAGSMMAVPAFIKNLATDSPNDRVNVAVIGVSGDRPRVRAIPRGRGIRHIHGYARVPNVKVTAVCDVDERLLPFAVKETENLFESTPKTEVEYRNLLEDQDIDVISVVTPNHWHALQTIWACQAGKDVYVASYEYEDGVIIQAEVRNLYTNMEGSSPRLSMIYTDEGWIEFTGGGYRAFVGRSSEPEYSLSGSDIPDGEEINGWQEFIDCVRNKRIQEFRNNIIEGHMSAALPHLANISYRTGRKLRFNPATEQFVNDSEANRYLSRRYRAPYTMPENE